MKKETRLMVEHCNRIGGIISVDMGTTKALADAVKDLEDCLDLAEHNEKMAREEARLCRDTLDKLSASVRNLRSGPVVDINIPRRRDIWLQFALALLGGQYEVGPGADDLVRLYEQRFGPLQD